MVFDFKFIVLLEQIRNLVGKVIRTETSLRGSQVVETRRDPHIGKNIARLDGVVKELEECGLFVCRETVEDLCRGFI